MYFRLVLLLAVLAVVVPAAQAFADAAPSFPTTQREYYVQGLEAYPEYNFLIVHERVRRDGDLRVHTIEEEKKISLRRYRLGYRSYFIAVTEEVPDNPSMDWFEDADALKVECAQVLPSRVRSIDDNRAIKLEKVTFKVQIPNEEEEETEEGEASEGTKDGNEVEPPDESRGHRGSLFGDPPSERTIKGIEEGPLRLIPARLVRLDKDREVMLEKDLLAEEEGDEDANGGEAPSKGEHTAASNRAATNSGVLIFASGFGVLLLLGLVALRRMRD